MSNKDDEDDAFISVAMIIFGAILLSKYRFRFRELIATSSYVDAAIIFFITVVAMMAVERVLISLKPFDKYDFYKF
jgi:hypothetical protein